MTDHERTDRPTPEEIFERLTDLRPEEAARLIRVSRLSERQFQRLEAVTDMSEDEWALISDGVALVRSIQVVGKVARWFIIGLVGFFLGVVAFGDAIIRFKAFFMGAPK